ncbi:MAG: sensor histidine kinase [Eubacterium sp.]|nr:sensor histidine kinase [Eubacterium sp.]
MRFRDYLKDHIVAIVIEITALVSSNIFMSAFKINVGLRIAVTTVFVMAFLISFLWDFWRRSRFFNTMEENLRQLDQKYLIAETLEGADYYEGEFINEMIREMGKSMYEHVADARRYAGDFKEYIEMWVHEVKLPIAALMLRVNNLREELAEKVDASETETAEDETTGRNTGDVEGDRTSENDEETVVDNNHGFIATRLRELAEAEEQLRRINDHIEQVLYYARSENTEKDYVIRETKLGRTVASVLQANRSFIQEKGVTLKVHDLDRTVVTDSKWLEFIISQFLSNSLRYTSAEKEPLIEIYSEEKNGDTILHFRDNGTGIPSEELGRIWDKTFTGTNGRLDGKQSEGHFGSTGMGLYIVKKLCSKLGHRAAVESEYGEFTDMMIVFGKNDVYKI